MQPRIDGAGAESPVRAVIVDDEPLARDCVRLALGHQPGVEVVAECADGEQAVDAIRRHRPDLVFLDVQMPGVDGFGVIERVGVEEMPAVVFVTAFDEHALRAFEVHAVDYVLKPFDDARFGDAVRHACRQLRAGGGGELRRTLHTLLRELRSVRVDDVDWFEAAGNYVRIHAGAQAHLVRLSLSGLGDKLDPGRFVRIHRSTIVNVEKIAEVQPWFGGDYLALLHDGRQLKVSRSFRDRLLRTMA
jgi:two-component system LytT family response regulator